MSSEPFVTVPACGEYRDLLQGCFQGVDEAKVGMVEITRLLVCLSCASLGRLVGEALPTNVFSGDTSFDP